MYIPYFVYSLCCFHVLAIVNNATMNVCTCGIPISMLWSVYPEVDFLNDIEMQCLSF